MEFESKVTLEKWISVNFTLKFPFGKVDFTLEFHLEKLILHSNFI